MAKNAPRQMTDREWMDFNSEQSMMGKFAPIEYGFNKAAYLAQRFIPCQQFPDAPAGGAKGNGVLVLTIKREPLIEILLGRKKEEYRSPSVSYADKLHEQRYTMVELRNGRDADIPVALVEFREAVYDTVENQFVIRLGKVVHMNDRAKILVGAAVARK